MPLAAKSEEFRNGEMNMKKTFVLVLLSAIGCFAQIVLPEGTKIRVRLEQTISSSTAEEGHLVELSVTDEVKVGDTVVIAEGAHVSGTVTLAHEKRRMGRAGKLDFSIDRVKAIDNQWVPLRYSVTRKAGQSHALTTGILTAGVAAVFWPAAPVFLLRKGQDITINRDAAFDVYTDRNHTVKLSSRLRAGISSRDLAPISIAGSVPDADVDVDGTLEEDAPTTLPMRSGPHAIPVKKGSRSWSRTAQETSGGNITLNAIRQ